MSGHRQPLRCLHHRPHSSPQLSRCPDVRSHLALRVARLQPDLSKPGPEATSTPPAHVNRVVWEPASPRKTPGLPAPDHSPVPRSIFCRHSLRHRFSAQLHLVGEGLVPE
ncbi:PREDICTED: uncharacterized protein LOC105512034 [Colobus angolensis palliatus]|uniref:uncharacterized protein LOC105512034 n=1 Tax=Colobus angolensis palliatus TaxID=336983 RepID=UPI0005F4682D|nr:PREDICTED: uncharacterized protein LOC105512034 [Colobus angolensis palliatus]